MIPSSLAILDALDRAGAQTPEKLAGMLRVSRDELNAAMYEVARNAWVITLGPVGYADPKTQISYLSLTSEGTEALHTLRALAV